LTGYDWAITDGEGNDLTPALLHHFNIIDPNRRELFYPIARRVFAAGRETPAATMPPMVGVPIRGNAPMLLVTMLANTTGKDYSDVYFRLWISYTTRDEATIKPKSVYPLYIDSGGPVGPRSYEVPPGETVEAYSASPATGGRIVALGGHLHDYGKRLILRDMTADKTIWDAKPLTDEPDHVTGMPVKVFPFPWQGKLDPDHTYRIQARYENPTSENAPDRGMGSIGGVFIPSGDMEWASPDYNNPTYLDDMVITLGSHRRKCVPDWASHLLRSERCRLSPPLRRRHRQRPCRSESRTTAPVQLFLLSNYLDERAFSPAAVKFPVKYLFPRAKIQFTVRDGYYHLAPHDLALHVGVCIIFSHVVPVT